MTPATQIVFLPGLKQIRKLNTQRFGLFCRAASANRYVKLISNNAVRRLLRAAKDTEFSLLGKKISFVIKQPSRKTGKARLDKIPITIGSFDGKSRARKKSKSAGIGLGFLRSADCFSAAGFWKTEVERLLRLAPFDGRCRK